MNARGVPHSSLARANVRASPGFLRVSEARSARIKAISIALKNPMTNGLATLIIIIVANKYALLQIARRRLLNEWEAFKKVISRRNIRRRITIPMTLTNVKLLRRRTRAENILHRNFTRRQVAIKNRVNSIFFLNKSAPTVISLLPLRRPLRN